MAIERGIRHFESEVVAASRSVMLEVLTILGAYRKALVLIGGWVLYFLLRERWNVQAAHVGSIDIDFVVDHNLVSDVAYRGIVEMLVEHGYRPKDRERVPYEFVREISRGNGLPPIAIAVDFLAPECGGTSPSHRHQRAGDLLARKARGCDIVFDHRWLLSLQGTLPSGAVTAAEMWVADLTASMTTKGIALDSRFKEKDAYDLYMMLAYHHGGPAGVADEVRPYREHPLVAEALQSISRHFASPRHNGPQWVADFFGEAEGEARERRVTDAYMRVAECLRRLEHAS